MCLAVWCVRDETQVGRQLQFSSVAAAALQWQTWNEFS